MPKKTSGFTLMELMISLSVAVILAAISTPFVHEFYQKIQFKDTVHALENAILQTRQTALSSGQETMLCPYSENASCGLAWHAGLTIRQKDSLLYQYQSFPKGISIELADSFNKPYLIFNPMGFTSQNGHFILSQKRGNCLYESHIVIRKSGHMHTEENHLCQ